MTEQMFALARRAIACKGWRWMPGMLTQNGSRIYDVVDSDYCYGDADCHEWQNEHGWGINRCDYHNGRPLADTSSGHLWLDLMLPNFNDPATLGCLLELVREAFGDPRIYTRTDPEDLLWYVVTDVGAAWSTMEAGALVAALEAAP